MKTKSESQRKQIKIAVILNGCGHRDGSEIHESVLTLLGIEEAGATWEALALNRDQARVVDHLNGVVQEGASPRNMLRESARIARGRIKDLALADIADYDGIVIPGGSGTASNLCDFASRGSKMSVASDLRVFLEAAHQLKKPIGAVCISPIILAHVFGKSGVQLTLGDVHGDAAKAASAMGADVVGCRPDSCVIDETNKIITTPAYMLEAGVVDIAKGILSLAKEVVRLS